MMASARSHDLGRQVHPARHSDGSRARHCEPSAAGLRRDRGTTLDLGYGVRLQALHPGGILLEGTASDGNNNGLVLRLSWGKASFLFTGDLGMEGEAYLLAQEGLPLDSTVLKVAHHGAKEGTSLRFLEAVTPQIAVVSVGVGNRFGHPSAEVLERLEEAGAQVWRTDECEDVEVVTDGERLWVRTGKGRMQPD
jgi:beta-lactamase superfamily II metal-dependent hydrolase